MKKIKIIVSDFHLSKGIRLPDGSLNELEDFFETDRFLEMVEHYSSGKYESYNVELIANGDFFDLLSVDRNRNFSEKITEDLSVEKMRLIIRGHDSLFQGLADFCSKKGKQLSFVVGNHDAGLLWDRVQVLLRDRISPAIKFFPEDYRSDGLFVAHGHQYEFINSFNTRDFYYKDSDGQKILRLPWGSYFVLNVIAKEKYKRPEIHRTHPFRKYLRWTFYNDHMFFWRILAKMIYFWVRNRLHPDRVRRREFVLSPDRIHDAATHRSLPRIAEEILVNTSYRVVVFGHTHKTLYRNFGIHGEFFNTGTWTEVIDLELATLGRRLEHPYIFIEYKDGHPRAKLLRWFGKRSMYEEIV